MEETPVNPTYQKGFNEGYIITKHLPDLSEILSLVKNNSPHIDGFKDGRKQYVLEQTKEHRPSWLMNNRSDNRPPEKSKDKDYDRE